MSHYKDLAIHLRRLEEGQASRCGALNALREDGIPALIILIREAIKREIHRESLDPTILDKAIERALEKSEEELAESPRREEMKS
jgi:hypothetical protein